MAGAGTSGFQTRPRPWPPVSGPQDRYKENKVNKARFSAVYDKKIQDLPS